MSGYQNYLVVLKRGDELDANPAQLLDGAMDAWDVNALHEMVRVHDDAGGLLRSEDLVQGLTSLDIAMDQARLHPYSSAPPLKILPGDAIWTASRQAALIGCSFRFHEEVARWGSIEALRRMPLFDRGFKRWRTTQIRRAAQLAEEALVKGEVNEAGRILADAEEQSTFSAYLRACTRQRRVIVDLVLGPFSRSAAGARMRSNAANMWPSFAHRISKLAGANSEQNLLDILKTPGKLEEKLGLIWDERYNILRGAQARKEDWVADKAEYIRNYAHRYSKKGNKTWQDSPDLSTLDQADIRKMVGQKKLHEDEAIERLLEAEFLLEDLLEKMEIWTGTKALWQLNGIHGFMQKAVTREGWEHGYLFEYVATRMRFFPENQTVAEMNDMIKNLFLQVKIGLLDGPDYVLRQGMIARIFEAKSVKSMTSLTGVGGEMARQIGSHFRRMWKENGALTLAVKAEDTGKVDMLEAAREVTFLIDLKRINPPKPLSQIEAHFKAETDLLNNILKNTNRAASNQPMVDKILEGTDDYAFGSMTLKDLLQQALAENPNMAVQELMLLRMTAETGKTTRPADVLQPAVVQELLKRQPPLEIGYELLDTKHVFLQD